MKVSNDWWRGAVNGKTGLIPDKYISLKIKWVLITFISFILKNIYIYFFFRDEDRDKSDLLKSSSSEESVRKRRPSGNISLNSQLSICTQNSNTLSNITCGSDFIAPTVQGLSPGHQQPQHPKFEPITTKPISIISDKCEVKDSDYIHYDTVDNVKGANYNYHDEPHSFETSLEFLEDMNHFTFEVLETTVWSDSYSYNYVAYVSMFFTFMF